MSGAGRLERTKRRRGAHLFGLKAESIAALMLRFKGYRILARRFVVSGGEIDLIARRGGSIVFVEVKARADIEIAAISISATKRRRIARAARGLAGPESVGGGPDPSGRRRIRRAWTPSPSHAIRVSAHDRLIPLKPTWPWKRKMRLPPSGPGPWTAQRPSRADAIGCRARTALENPKYRTHWP